MSTTHTHTHTYLSTSHLPIGWLSIREHLPEGHSIAPDVTGMGESAIVDGLRGVPFDRPPPSLRGLVVVAVGPHRTRQTKVTDLHL